MGPQKETLRDFLKPIEKKTWASRPIKNKPVSAQGEISTSLNRFISISGGEPISKVSKSKFVEQLKAGLSLSE